MMSFSKKRFDLTSKLRMCVCLCVYTYKDAQVPKEISGGGRIP